MFVIGEKYVHLFATIADDLYYSDFGEQFPTVQKVIEFAANFIQSNRIDNLSARELCRAKLQPVVHGKRIPEELHKQFSRELRKYWRDIQGLPEYGHDISFESKLTKVSKCVDEIVDRVGLMEFPLHEKNGEFLYSLKLASAGNATEETLFMLKGNVDRFIKMDGEIHIKSPQGDVLISTSFLFLRPFWKIDTIRNADEDLELFAAVNETMSLFSEVSKRLKIL